MKHSVAQAAKWIVAGCGAALAWIAIVSTPRTDPDDSARK